MVAVFRYSMLEGAILKPEPAFVWFDNFRKIFSDPVFLQSIGHTLYFAVEVIGYLELGMGTHTFGMSVAADRTDVNDDDSYVVFCGVNPRSFFGTQVGEYERFAQPFVSDQRNTNYFTFDVPRMAFILSRLLWQTGLGSLAVFRSSQLLALGPDQ
jgi:hypothetical protein